MTLAAYEPIAPFYDAFTHHPGYAGWVERLEHLARRHGLRGRRALDVGCGTGNSLGPLLEAGYEVAGVDCSPAMLAIAAGKLGGRARLHVADMRALPRLGSFDLVWCLNDGINCLVDPADLAPAFAGVRANLAPGGVFLFDANTTLTYETFFAATHRRECAGAEVTWQGLAAVPAPPGGAFEARLEIRTPEGTLASEHRQRHHPRRRIEDALREAGLALAAVLGQTAEGALEDRPDERLHTKCIYVAHPDPERR